MTEFIRCWALLLALLNPFLVIVYLVDMVEKLDRRRFRRILVAAGLIAGAVFCAFAILGDAVFSDITRRSSPRFRSSAAS